MVILASQSGDFARDKGRQVAETLLQAHPDATIVYAHNDEMALGAIAAIEAAGKVPGKDILVVSIDGEKDAVQAIIDGKMGATCECNPRFGPKAFDIMYNYAGGEKIPPVIINPDRFFDASNAKEMLADRVLTCRRADFRLAEAPPACFASGREAAAASAARAPSRVPKSLNAVDRSAPRHARHRQALPGRARARRRPRSRSSRPRSWRWSARTAPASRR